MFRMPPPHVAQFAPALPDALRQVRAAPTAPSPPPARARRVCSILQARAAPVFRPRARARASYWRSAGPGLLVCAADRAADRPAASCCRKATKEICYASGQPGATGTGQRPSRNPTAGALRGTHEHDDYCTGRTEPRVLIAVGTMSVCIADRKRASSRCSGVQLHRAGHDEHACFPGMDRTL